MYQEQQKMGGDMAMMAIPPFHHGTLYSSSAFVLWYLMRVEPFTSLHIHLQVRCHSRFFYPCRGEVLPGTVKCPNGIPRTLKECEIKYVMSAGWIEPLFE